MKKFILILVIALSLLSCQKGWYVLPENGITNENKAEALKYYLPRTSFEIKLVVNEHHFVPGPFADFAESYLNISGVEQQEKYFWSFADVSVKPIYESDPDALFWVFPKSIYPKLSYTGQSQLIGVNADVKANDTDRLSRFYKQPTDFPEDILYTDLSVKRNTYEVIDTTWRIIERDSVIERIPIYKSIEQEKNWHHKAEDAANFIIRIRKRKFKLMAAIDEQQAGANNAGIMIESLKQLEQSYVNLFIGKTITKTKVYSFRVTPESSKQNQRIHLADLSKKTASPQKSASNTLPLTVEISAVDNKEQTDVLPENIKDAGLYVRDANMADFKILLDKDVIYKSQEIIPQLYPVKFIHSKVFSSDTKVYINAKSGNLERIE